MLLEQSSSCMHKLKILESRENKSSRARKSKSTKNLQDIVWKPIFDRFYIAWGLNPGWQQIIGVCLDCGSVQAVSCFMGFEPWVTVDIRSLSRLWKCSVSCFLFFILLLIFDIFVFISFMCKYLFFDYNSCHFKSNFFWIIFVSPKLTTYWCKESTPMAIILLCEYNYF